MWPWASLQSLDFQNIFFFFNKSALLRDNLHTINTQIKCVWLTWAWWLWTDVHMHVTNHTIKIQNISLPAGSPSFCKRGKWEYLSPGMSGRSNEVILARYLARLQVWSKYSVNMHRFYNCILPPWCPLEAGAGMGAGAAMVSLKPSPPQCEGISPSNRRLGIDSKPLSSSRSPEGLSTEKWASSCPQAGPEHRSSVLLRPSYVCLQHWRQGQLHELASCQSLRTPCSESPVLGLMFWCHLLAIFNNFEQGTLSIYFTLGPAN